MPQSILVNTPWVAEAQVVGSLVEAVEAAAVAALEAELSVEVLSLVVAAWPRMRDVAQEAMPVAEQLV